MATTPTAPARPAGPGPLGLLTVIAGRRDALAFFADVAARQPRVAHVRMGGEHVYVLSDPDLVRAMLVTYGRSTVKGRALQRMRRLLGDGLLTSEGELHRRQRRLVQPAFHSSRIAAYVPVIVETALEHSAPWRDGQHVDLAERMSALTLDVVGRALFGADLRAETAEVGTALSTLLTGFQRQVLPGAEALLRVRTRRVRELVAAMDALDAVVRRVVEARRSAPPGDDLLWAMMTAHDAEGGPAMDPERLRDEAMTLLLAGHETTATALAWTWSELSRTPAARAAVHAELDALLGRGEAARPPTAADLPALHRTTAAFAEAMRLWPPAWILGRRATADLEIDGWTVPAGSLLVTSQWVLHRDPKWWPEPLAYRPERWLDADGRFAESAPGVPRGAWFPFGLGSRVCVGEPFAWAEGVLVLAALGARWDPVVDPGAPAGTQPAVTLRPRGGLPATLRAR